MSQAARRGPWLAGAVLVLIGSSLAAAPVGLAYEEPDHDPVVFRMDECHGAACAETHCGEDTYWAATWVPLSITFSDGTNAIIVCALLLAPCDGGNPVHDNARAEADEKGSFCLLGYEGTAAGEYANGTALAFTLVPTLNEGAGCLWVTELAEAVGQRASDRFRLCTT